MTATATDGAIRAPVDDSLARIAIDLGPRSYDIVVGAGLLAKAGALMGPVLRQPRVVTISDDTVAALHLDTLDASLDAAGIRHDSIILPPGEESKSWATLETLTDRLLAARVERSTTLLALGGGVIGDLTGFAAGITLRGLDFVQIPTTLLAQVDSAVGGKTGLNTRRGKNLIGTFHQPRLVIADTAVLDSLPPRALRAGYAETVKYGLIGEPGFFAWLEDHGAEVIAGDREARRHAVVAACRAKAAIVAEDEREAGKRALLNLGHTFGHALEAETGFGATMLHGEAVALGTIMAFDLSVSLGLCPPADAHRVRAHFAAMDLPVSVSAFAGTLVSAALIAHMRQDKKVRDGRIHIVLVRGIGRAFVSDSVAETALADFLDQALTA